MTEQKSLLETAQEFFDNPENAEQFLDVVLHRSAVSLRLLDNLCVNFSRNFMCKSDQELSLYNKYRTQLRTFSKKNFDPFCRHRRVSVTMYDKRRGENTSVETTVGQLNFFQWAIKNQVLQYALDNMENIEKFMKVYKKPAEEQRGKSGVVTEQGGLTVTFS